MQHFLIALALFLAVLFFFLMPSRPPVEPAVTTWTSAEQDYYKQIFSYTMDNVAAGAHFYWETQNGKGSIAPDEPFISKSSATCRNFSQTVTFQGRTGSGQGISCKRASNDGWCQLKKGDALT